MIYNIGIISPSDIAFRRFLPSLLKVKNFKFAGVAIANPWEWAENGDVTQNILDEIAIERNKAQKFIDFYGGRIYSGYQTLITSEEIDVVYLPLPPALHFNWVKLVLENGKSAYVEKPFTTSLENTRSLLSIAKEKKLALHENYMFIFHQQIKEIDKIIAKGEIGKVRHYRISFGFPHRLANDFRYNKALGGGALLDAGGYCIKYANYLLGNSAKMVCASSYYEKEHEIDIFGACTMTNDIGTIVQISFGMDNDYKCEVEAWGATGSLTTNRVFTAPDDFEPVIYIKRNQEVVIKKLPADSAFEKSILRFYECLTSDSVREENYNEIERQSTLVSDFLNLCIDGK